MDAHTNALLIDPEGGEHLSSLTVEGETITALGADAPKGAEVIDAGGHCLAPGIADGCGDGLSLGELDIGDGDTGALAAKLLRQPHANARSAAGHDPHLARCPGLCAGHDPAGVAVQAIEFGVRGGQAGQITLAAGDPAPNRYRLAP